MKALSVRQPWTFAITDLGKSVENRTWETKYRGPILLHAALGCTRREWTYFYNGVHSGTAPYAEAALRALGNKKVPELNDLPRGGFVARANIIECIHESEKHFLRPEDNPWFFGPYGFILNSVEPIKFVPYRGALGFFNVPDDLVLEAASITPA